MKRQSHAELNCRFLIFANVNAEMRSKLVHMSFNKSFVLKIVKKILMHKTQHRIEFVLLIRAITRM